MSILTRQAHIDAILDQWRPAIGEQFDAYRGHVLRMFNFALLLGPTTEVERDKLAIAAAFHDMGIWSDDTLDYLPPSARLARDYAAQQEHEAWAEEIGLMVEKHHRPARFDDARYPLVERFRKADLVDFSWGLVRFGLPLRVVREVQSKLPNAGFHAFLARRGTAWMLRHPLNPMPFLKW